MLMPPVLSSRLPTGTFLPCAQEGRSRSTAGNPIALPATAVLSRKSRRVNRLAIAFPLRPPEFEVNVTEAVSTDLYRGQGYPSRITPEWLGWLAIFTRVSSANCLRRRQRRC